MHSFLHWLNVEYWGPSWPNIFAPNAWTILAIVISHLHIYYLHLKHHNELMGRS